jgi:hypothetical protein
MIEENCSRNRTAVRSFHCADVTPEQLEKPASHLYVAAQEHHVHAEAVVSTFRASYAAFAVWK